MILRNKTMSGAFSRRWLALQIAVVSSCLGCGPNEVAAKSRYPLTGKVTYNGSPIEKGLLVLQPRGAGQPVSANINAGAYQFTATDGPFAGNYHVIVTRSGAEETVVLPKNRGFGGGGRDFPPPKRPVDTAGKKNSFELDYEVPADPKAVHDFDLKD